MRKSKAETARTRERILEAAGSQFLTHGLTDAGLTRVMKAAGLTNGGFYRHFASKDELIAELVGQMKRSPAQVPAILSLFSVTRHLEQIADHATNIAEEVVYLYEAKDIRHSDAKKSHDVKSPVR